MPCVFLSLFSPFSFSLPPFISSHYYLSYNIGLLQLHVNPVSNVVELVLQSYVLNLKSNQGIGLEFEWAKN